MTNDEKQPWVDNYPRLKEWLTLHGARCMWQQPVRSPGEARHTIPAISVECWQFPSGTHVLVRMFSEKVGWDLFTSLPGIEVTPTLRDAEQRLRLVANPSTHELVKMSDKPEPADFVARTRTARAQKKHVK